MNVIETFDLSHKFGNGELALNNVNLQVQEGSIYGFLGPNGAGKTTTLKLIIGLLSKQHGDIHIFGKPFEKNRIDILKNIGSMIESPSIYGHLTARENLKLLQMVYRCPEKRIGEALELVGLANTGSKKAAQFSLGMKQRLSLAIALLHNPSLLILDEPTNGLDPNGILEMRELMRRLNREHGITILVSSHLLAEIEKLVSHTGIIHKGKILFQGTLDELMKKRNQGTMIRLETSDNTRTSGIISADGTASRLNNGWVEIPALEKEKIAAINRELVSNGIDIYGISRVENDLESIFFDVIGE